jgi:hypothetical protein
MSETAKIRTALDAVCWQCVQDSNFWAEWCPEIRRRLFPVPSSPFRLLPKRRAEMSEMSEIPDRPVPVHPMDETAKMRAGAIHE